MQDSYSFTLKNSSEKTLNLGIEPWGFYWALEPGDEFEIVFDDAKNFWSIETVDFSEDNITYWAIYPSAVYLLAPDGTKEEMMSA